MKHRLLRLEALRSPYRSREMGDRTFCAQNVFTL
jgi:hypothetical protein